MLSSKSRTLPSSNSSRNSGNFIKNYFLHTPKGHDIQSVKALPMQTRQYTAEFNVAYYVPQPGAGQRQSQSQSVIGPHDSNSHNNNRLLRRMSTSRDPRAHQSSRRSFYLVSPSEDETSTAESSQSTLFSDTRSPSSSVTSLALSTPVAPTPAPQPFPLHIPALEQACGSKASSQQQQPAIYNSTNGVSLSRDNNSLALTRVPSISKAPSPAGASEYKRARSPSSARMRHVSQSYHSTAIPYLPPQARASSDSGLPSNSTSSHTVLPTNASSNNPDAPSQIFSNQPLRTSPTSVAGGEYKSDTSSACPVKRPLPMPPQTSTFNGERYTCQTGMAPTNQLPQPEYVPSAPSTAYPRAEDSLDRSFSGRRTSFRLNGDSTFIEGNATSSNNRDSVIRYAETASIGIYAGINHELLDTNPTSYTVNSSIPNAPTEGRTRRLSNAPAPPPTFGPRKCIPSRGQSLSPPRLTTSTGARDSSPPLSIPQPDAPPLVEMIFPPSVDNSIAEKSRYPLRDPSPPAPPPTQRTTTLSVSNRRQSIVEALESQPSVCIDIPESAAPRRRKSDGDKPFNNEPGCRNVRWNSNLICPSPIFSNQRRKGWFNRRGDQLWTNGGSYKPPCHGQEYPPDLESYPEYGDGWMNEEGVRIDMNHRLIPKVPLRSALKQSCKISLSA